MKEPIRATVLRKNATEELIELYEKFPHLRGKSPNKLVNIAWDQFIYNMLGKTELTQLGKSGSLIQLQKDQNLNKEKVNPKAHNAPMVPGFIDQLLLNLNMKQSSTGIAGV